MLKPSKSVMEIFVVSRDEDGCNKQAVLPLRGRWSFSSLMLHQLAPEVALTENSSSFMDFVSIFFSICN